MLPYLDIPFQHASPSVLRAMRRPGDQEKTLERIAQWRAICPDLTIRSTFIVGFPGETEARLRVLSSTGLAQQSSTASAPSDMSRSKAPPPTSSVCRRSSRSAGNRATAVSWSGRRRSARASCKEKVGKRLAVIIDQGGAAGGRRGARKGDAPDIDGKVHIVSKRPLRVGEIVNVKIERADAYDLYGTAV